MSDYPSLKSLIQQGYISEWNTPTSNRISASYRIGSHCYATYVTNIVIAYNVNKVTPEEVKILGSSWKGVLDPRFKGRFAVNTMKIGTTYVAIHMFLDPKNAKVFGPEFIKAVAAQKPTVYADTLVALDRVVAGEHDFGFWSWEAAALPALCTAPRNSGSRRWSGR
jgi:ABC-type Fe3+ transport system substrate-binding protein